MRTAILGCGSIGRRWMRNLIELGETSIIAYDPAGGARQNAQNQYGVQVRSQLEEVWESRPEAAFITSPASSHVELAIAAASHGCHLFIEKPLSHTLDRSAELIEELRSRKRLAMVGCNMRFHPGPRMIKQILDSGALGRPLYARIHCGSFLPEWRPQTDYRESCSARPELGGGAALECIHEVDLAHWYFGPGEVVAASVLAASSIGLSVEGLMEIMVRHTHQTLVSIHLSFIQRDYQRSCQIVAEKGSLSWNFENSWLEIKTGKSDSSRTELNIEGQPDRMYIDELRHFLRCLESREQPMSSVEDGMAALRTVLRAKAFAGEPQAQPFPYPERGETGAGLFGD